MLHTKDHNLVPTEGSDASLVGKMSSTKTKSQNSILNPVVLTIHTNVACIELLLWAIREDSGKIMMKVNVTI